MKKQEVEAIENTGYNSWMCLMYGRKLKMLLEKDHLSRDVFCCWLLCRYSSFFLQTFCFGELLFGDIFRSAANLYHMLTKMVFSYDESLLLQLES